MPTHRTWGTPPTSKNPIIFIHGLPGLKSKQNQDLAQHIHDKAQRDVILPFGAGLGINPGTFLFSEEISQRRKLIESLPSDNITLVGHSWGGYQSLILAALYPEKIKTLILMSPLLGLFPRQEFNTVLDALEHENPEAHFAERSELLDDADATTAKHPIEATIRKILPSTDITFLQAIPDPITTPERAKGLLPLFQKKPNYLELESDHQFLVNRPLLIDALTRALSKN